MMIDFHSLKPPRRFGKADAMALLMGVLMPFTLLAKGAASSFEAMVIHPTGKFAYHEPDLDYGLNKTGIPFKHYAVEDGATILSDLDRYSLVMCTPLANLNDIFTGHEATVRTWVEKGNVLVITDACDAQYFNPFLGALIPEAALKPCGCQGSEGVKSLFVRDTAPPHPMRCFPERLDYESRQWHCLQADKGWETVTTCSGPGAIHPVTVLYSLGKGFVYVSSMQQRWSALPANLRANLLLRRVGLVPVSYSLTPPALGANNLHLELKPITDPISVQFRLKVEFPSDPTRNGVGAPIVKPDKDGRIVGDFNFGMPISGPARMTFEAQTTSSGWITLFDRSVDIPPALSVLPPHYRGRLSEGRRIPKVSFEVLNPGNGPKAGFNSATVSVYDTKGKLLGSGQIRSSTNVTSLAVPVPLPKLAAGDGYRVKAIARNTYGAIKEASTNFVIRSAAEHPGETLIDEDNTLLVDGQPFFPLGIYHLAPGDYPEVAGMGFNTVLTLQWMTRKRESLDAAQALGLKVVFENNEKTLGGHHYLPGFLRDHPALLMWYAPDEPLHEADYVFARDVADIYRKGDPFHPVICVHFNPPRYALCSKFSDIFATECYVISKDGNSPYWKVPEFMEITHEAAQGHQPVFAVPNATGGQSAQGERVVTWLALTHDARGLFWYAWDEGNGVGMKYDEALKGYMKDLLAQLRELTPALVAPVRRPFVTDGVHGIVCDDGAYRTLLVINMAEQPRPVPSIPEFQGLAPSPVFGEPAIKVLLEPLECRAYRSTVRSH